MSCRTIWIGLGGLRLRADFGIWKPRFRCHLTPSSSSARTGALRGKKDKGEKERIVGGSSKIEGEGVVMRLLEFGIPLTYSRHIKMIEEKYGVLKAVLQCWSHLRWLILVTRRMVLLCLNDDVSPLRSGQGSSLRKVCQKLVQC